MNQAELDALLNTTICDLEDLPEFKNPAPGVHKVIFDWKVTEVNKKPAIAFHFKAVETIELANPEKDVPVTLGDEFSVNNIMDNAFGQGMVKLASAKACAALGLDPEVTGIGAALEPCKGAEIVIFTSIKTVTKDGKTSEYLRLDDMEFDIDAWMAGLEAAPADQALAEEVVQQEPAVQAQATAPTGLGLKLGGLKLGAK